MDSGFSTLFWFFRNPSLRPTASAPVVNALSPALSPLFSSGQQQPACPQCSRDVAEGTDHRSGFRWVNAFSEIIGGAGAAPKMVLLLLPNPHLRSLSAPIPDLRLAGHRLAMTRVWLPRSPDHGTGRTPEFPL